MANYKGSSIVDYLKSIGKPSSFGERTKLAQQQGIKSYAGTASQNTQLLGLLRKPIESTISPTKKEPAKTPDVSLGDWRKGGQEWGGYTAPVGSPERKQQAIERSRQLLEGTEAGKALEKKLAIPVPPTPPAKDLTIGAAVGTPDLPQGATTTDTKAYTDSVLTDLQNKKQAVLDMYNKQLEDITKKRESAEKSIADLEAKQKDLLEEDVEPLLAPFREKLEKSERERLKIEENFFANQKLTDEMETLLTGLQSEVASAEAQTGLSSILTPRINKLKEDVNARVGVIQAVMSARNGQIGVANNLIDRSISAIEGDRKDQLAYYEAIYNFYGEQKDTEGKKLITLTGDQKDYINRQISFLESEAELSQDTVSYIKNAMINPQYADFMARAGIKLTDSVPEIQEKLSTETYKQEIIELNNEMEGDGYQFLPAGQGAKPSNEISVMRDSRGREYTYWKEGGVEGVDTVDIFSTKDMNRLIATGLAPNDITSIQNDIRDYGIDAVKEGLTEEQLRTVEQILGGITPTQAQKLAEEKAEAEKVFLDKDYFKERFTSKQVGEKMRELYTEEELSKLAKDSGFGKWQWGKGTEINEYLKSEKATDYYFDYLLKMIESERERGKSDNEILKMMK